MPISNRLTRRRALAVGLASLGLLAGCGKNERPMTDVSGTVTFDGAPLPDGQILIRHTSGEQRGYEATITGGAYQLRCEPGEVRVEITAIRDIPGKFQYPNGVKEPVRESYIPEKYNTKSTLMTTLTPGDNDDVSFELTTK